MYRGIRNIITIGLSIKKVSIETRKYMFFFFYSMKDKGGVSISTSICRYNITRRRWYSYLYNGYVGIQKYKNKTKARLYIEYYFPKLFVSSCYKGDQR